MWISKLTGVSPFRWKLLNRPGLILHNTRNSCWFHAGLQFLSASSTLLLRTIDNKDMSELSTVFKEAMEAIIHHGELTHIRQLFNLVKDFHGINNRYGQIAVPDFLEYLAAQLPQLQSFHFQLITKLQCGMCRWWSFNTTKDFMCKLYLSPKVGNSYPFRYFTVQL